MLALGQLTVRDSISLMRRESTPSRVARSAIAVVTVSTGAGELLVEGEVAAAVSGLVVLDGLVMVLSVLSPTGDPAHAPSATTVARRTMRDVIEVGRRLRPSWFPIGGVLAEPGKGDLGCASEVTPPPALAGHLPRRGRNTESALQQSQK